MQQIKKNLNQITTLIFSYTIGEKINIDIVGGSISGLSTAISIKKNNKKINVIVHEKHKKIGYNPDGRRCGEAHSIETQWKKWVPEKTSIYSNITRAEVIIGKKKYIFNRKINTGFVLNRQQFIWQLGKEAESLGTNIHTSDKIKSIQDLNSDYIIDASGCPSSIKREIGQDRGIKGKTYQETLEDSNYYSPNSIKIIYDGNFGYYWIFPRDPKKKEINIGIGYLSKIDLDLKNQLKEFKEKYQITGKKNYVLGGLIPCGLQRPLIYKNILFVGDAGVGTFPFTGQGIYRALISGDIAGKCIAKNQASTYKHIINKEFIKWDVIGKTNWLLCMISRKISQDLTLDILNLFIKTTGISK